MEEEALIKYLGSQEFILATSNATRLVAKLKLAIQKRELYETHQILRTVYFRLINAKDKVWALEELLYRGSCFLLKFNEHVSGQDIATLFLDAAAKYLQFHRESGNEDSKLDLKQGLLFYHTSRNTVDLTICQKISNIAIKLPETEIGQSKFIAEALRVLNPKILNRNLIHEALAVGFWQQKNFANCRYHYLYCANLENTKDIAYLLVEYQLSGANKSEVDLFITQFILQLLCSQCPADSSKLTKDKGHIKSIAESIFFSYTSKHPSLGQTHIPFQTLPLLNFTYFVISILDGKQEASTFRVLCDIYKQTWSRDPNYKSYLNRIGNLYFGIIDQSKQRQGGLFNNILMSLMEGPDEDDENSNQESVSSYDELD